MLRRIVAVGMGLPLHSAVGRRVPEFLRWSRSAALPRRGRGFVHCGASAAPTALIRRERAPQRWFAYSVCISMAGRINVSRCRKSGSMCGSTDWLLNLRPSATSMVAGSG